MPLPYAVSDALMEDSIWHAFWSGVFQVISLALVGLWVSVVYQRYRARAAARQALIDEINEFAIRLYKPRKLYQAMMEDSPALLAAMPNAARRQSRRIAMMHRSLDQLIGTIGRLRALQVKIIPLYGYHIELFGHYLAIWRYLKDIRHRMEQCESLLSSPDEGDSTDALYLLIDTFRYRVMIESIRRHPPGLVRPPEEVLKQMRQRADEIYTQFFGAQTPVAPS
jgi:hypothetical protein